MATAQRKRRGGRRLVLYGVSWNRYEKLLRVLEPARGLRITYDRGALEITTISMEHEGIKHVLGCLVMLLAEGMQIEIAGRGQMTFKRRRKQRGLEADECYWIQNEAVIRGKKVFDWESDPPPDLMLQVDISSSSLNRLAICAALRVPEVWRWDGEKIHVHVLGADGKYQTAERSRAFPFLKPAELVPFVAMAAIAGETATLRAFRQWIHERIAVNWTDVPPAQERP